MQIMMEMIWNNLLTYSVPFWNAINRMHPKLVICLFWRCRGFSFLYVLLNVWEGLTFLNGYDT